MEWIRRYYEDKFDRILQEDKVLVLHGSRQVGKTSLVNRVIKTGKDVFRVHSVVINWSLLMRLRKSIISGKQ